MKNCRKYERWVVKIALPNCEPYSTQAWLQSFNDIHG